MTPEQQKTLKTARERIKSRMMLFAENGAGLSPLERSAIELAHIVENHAAKIESMQKQLNTYSLISEAVASTLPRQYTEAEFREIPEFADNLMWITEYRSGFLDCARFLNTIKED